MGEFLITTDELAARVGCATAPVVIDVRRRAVFDSDDTTLPAARWRDHVDADGWAGALPAGAEVVVFCVHGHNVSQLATAILRQRGIAARTLAGGIEAYRAAGGHVVQKVPLVDWAGVRPSTWVTRARPKIDRIACPWLVRRFIDREARFLFVEPEHVVPVAEELGGIPYDIEGVDLTHVGDGCTFDALLQRFGLRDEALTALATIVRGADTGHRELAPEAAGLLAVSLGISALAGDDDHAALERGFPVYDALLAWLRQARAETHGWPPRRPA